MASLWETLKREADKESLSITQKKFGEMMHDLNIPDWKKIKIAKKVRDQGGYDNLPSGN